MKFIRFKTRLLLSFWLVLIVAICLPGVYIYNSLEDEIIAESKKEAFARLDFINWMMKRDQPFGSRKALDRWCRQLAGQLDYRISLITSGGAVIADSAVAFDELKFLENHADRPEIAGAREKGKASSLRFSQTLGRQLIYAAQKIELPERQSPSFLRLAVPLSAVEKRLFAYGRRFWIGIAFIFGLTFALSLYLSRKFESPVYEIIDRIRAIGGGDYSHRYILDASQEFYELSSAINDMADKISYQMEIISEQKQELEAILENMREGVMLLDRQGRIKSINKTLENMARCHRTCIGKQPMEVFVNADVQAACDRVIAGRPKHSFTLTLDEDTFYEVYLVRIPEGGVLVVFHNISQGRRVEKIRQDFVANVSHELKTPLTSIKGYVEALLSGSFSLPEDARSFLNTIQKNTNQMSNIVNDLLQLTRLQEKPLPQNQLTIDAAKCFETAWQTCLPMAEDKQIQLENRLTSPLPVKADESTLIRVFENLIHNAVRYTPAGKTIAVSCEEKPGQTLFAIADEGPGIAPKHQGRIFERFYRIDKERSRQSGGTGLGLAICKNAVTGMGGRIWVESPPANRAVGSVFYFTLPRGEEKGLRH